MTPPTPSTPPPGGPDPDLDQRLRAIFSEPTMSLTIPPGQWDRILAEARRRRRRGVLAGLSVAAAVLLVAVGAVGLTLLPRLAGRSGLATEDQAAGAASSASSTATQRPASTAPSASAPAGLPAGGPVPVGFQPVSVTTAADGMLYALGQAPCAKAPCTSLVRSTDWGRHWVGLQPPRVALAEPSPTAAGGSALVPGSLSTVGQVRFANPRDGWLFGGGLWATHDGAAGTSTWQRVEVGGSVLALATDGRQVWVFVADCSAAACQGGRLLSAPVASNTFTPVSGVSVPGPVTGAALGSTAGAVTLVVNGPDPRLFVSSGGAWSARPSPCAQGTGGLDQAVASAVDTAVIVATCAQPGQRGLTLTPYVSLDAGDSWSRTGKPVALAGGPHQIAVVDAGELALAGSSPGGGGVLLVSRDSGATWTPAAAPAQPGGWAWVGAAGGRVLLALPVTSEQIWMSSDAGASWHALTVR